MSALYLVACVAVKLDRPAEAKDLYVSPWFRKARTYVERQHAPWWILSAKYGLLDPNSIVQPYNEALNTMGIAARRAWARRVLSDLRPLVARGERVALLAGQRYREEIVPALSDLGVKVEIPMEGLKIGRQLQWLDTASARHE